jgi:large subunit ribosomal protein L32
MGLPSKKRTRTSKRDRASHFALKPTGLGKCEKCAAPILPHHACKACGSYRGKQGGDVKKRAERAARRVTKA